MQTIFTLSAYETSAEEFFEELRRKDASLVLDVRLKNSNQLCGFTKRKDLEYLVPRLTGAKYVHDLRFAPTPELLEGYLSRWIGWEEYAEAYRALLEGRGALSAFRADYGASPVVCLLGTATKKRRSHSEALQSMLTEQP